MLDRILLDSYPVCPPVDNTFPNVHWVGKDYSNPGNEAYRFNLLPPPSNILSIRISRNRAPSDLFSYLREDFDASLRGLGCSGAAQGVLFARNTKIVEQRLSRGMSSLVVALQ